MKKYRNFLTFFIAFILVFSFITPVFATNLSFCGFTPKISTYYFTNDKRGTGSYITSVTWCNGWSIIVTGYNATAYTMTLYLIADGYSETNSIPTSISAGAFANVFTFTFDPSVYFVGHLTTFALNRFANPILYLYDDSCVTPPSTGFGPGGQYSWYSNENSPTGVFTPFLNYVFSGYDPITRTASFAMISNMTNLAVTVPTAGIVSSQSFSSSTWALKVVLISGIKDGWYSLVAKGTGYQPGTTTTYTAYKIINFFVNSQITNPSDVQYKVTFQPSPPQIVNPQYGQIYLYKSIDKGASFTIVNTALYSCNVVIDTAVGTQDTNLTVTALGGAYRVSANVLDVIATESDVYKYTIVVEGVTLIGKFGFNGAESVVTTIYDNSGNEISSAQGLTGIADAIAKALEGLADKIKAMLMWLFVPTTEEVQTLEVGISDSSFNPFQGVSWPETSNSFTLFEGDTLGVSNDVVITIDDTGPFLIIKYAMYFVISFAVIWLIIEVL
jgi:hypothetical protein